LNKRCRSGDSTRFWTPVPLRFVSHAVRLISVPLPTHARLAGAFNFQQHTLIRTLCKRASSHAKSREHKKNAGVGIKPCLHQPHASHRGLLTNCASKDCCLGDTHISI
jgi:hypothetical protein